MELFDCPTCGKRHRTMERVGICAGYAVWQKEYDQWKATFKADPFLPDGTKAKEPYPETLLAFPGFSNQKRDYYWPVVVEAIKQRDRRTCQDCETRTGPFEIHHIIPRGMGGSDHPKNLKMVCKGCHKRYNEKFNGRIISRKARIRKARRAGMDAYFTGD